MAGFQKVVGRDWVMDSAIEPNKVGCYGLVKGNIRNAPLVSKNTVVRDGAGSKWPPVHKVHVCIGATPQKRSRGVKKLTDKITLVFYC